MPLMFDFDQPPNLNYTFSRAGTVETGCGRVSYPCRHNLMMNCLACEEQYRLTEKKLSEQLLDEILQDNEEVESSEDNDNDE